MTSFELDLGDLSAETDIKSLTEIRDILKKGIVELDDRIEEISSLAENNVFDSIDEAEAALTELMKLRAFDDCQGAYNCGEDKYYIQFIVNDISYIGTCNFEYNRHDKTYYYIESTRWSYAEIEG